MTFVFLPGLIEKLHNPARPSMPFSEIDGFNSQQYFHMGCNLNHGHSSRKCLSSSTAAVPTRPLKQIRIFIPD
ncbi:MAG: hypothetical protein CSA25_06340 [Desulfobacter postgatei]|uniref:Uncharacterized protein n=1 Tax=Desulfobacter postgatei TaxID=2293 RepID=A0A2G6MQ84_9BACT|nr:MAG: hypothetical protein CSA25_06340 [Desulfobacter postgatei]